MTHVVATAAVPEVAHEAFTDIGPISELRGPTELAQAEVLLVRSEQVGEGDINGAPRLKVIARTGSGVDNVDVEAATKRKVPVVFAPAGSARPVAEGTMALILAAAKRLGELRRIVDSGSWANRYKTEGLDLHGAVLGLVGHGQIGREVGRLARAFGMEILAHDPHLTSATESGVQLVSLEELAQRSDVLSLHCPLNADTRGLIDQAVLGSVKPGAIFVNTARGEIVADESLLVKALQDGRLGAVALDVFESEPLPASSPLLADPRVICTPHTIGLTRRWNRLVFSSLAEDVARFLRGKRPINVVDPDALDFAARGPG